MENVPVCLRLTEVTCDTPLKAVARKQTLVAVFTIFLFSILISLLIGPAGLAFSQFFNQDSLVGVKAGDRMLYWFYTTDPAMKNEAWVRVQVVRVSGTGITYWVVFHKEDRLEYNQTVTGDIFEFLAAYEYEYGRINTAPIFLPTNFTEANFSADFVNITLDYIHISHFTWNYGESTRNYGGVDRDVKVLNVTYYSTYRTEYCWDKTTGVLLTLKYLENAVSENSSDNSLMMVNDEYRIVDTNLWNMSYSSNTQLLKILTISAILVCLTIIPINIRRRNKSQNDNSTVTNVKKQSMSDIQVREAEKVVRLL